MHDHKFKLLLFFLTIVLIFINCSSGAYQDWYADEGEEEDLLAGMFSDADYEEDTEQQPITSGRWDNWYNDGTTPKSDPTNVQPGTSDEQEQISIPQKAAQNAASNYNLEFKVSLVNEIKIERNNQLTLILKSSVRVPEIKQMQWKTVKNSSFGQIEGDAILLNQTSAHEREDGLFELTFSPSNPDDYFSFVSLAEAGINAPGFAAPFNALALRTLNIGFTAATNHGYSYQYSYQTYNINDVAVAFAEKILSPHIKKVTINILDSETHFPISGAVVTLNGAPPSPMNILSGYITDTNVLLKAVKAAPHYAAKTTLTTTANNGTILVCYYPFSYHLNIVHPNYYYIDEDVSIDESTTTLTYFLTKRPENVRVLKKDGTPVN